MKNSKEFEQTYGDIAKDAVRVQVEMEIDCFLSQIVGAVDSLLVQINDKLELVLAIENVRIDTVQDMLNAKTKNIDLLGDLHKAGSYDNWFWLLRELRNHTLHRAALRRIAEISAFTDDPSKVRFLKKQRHFDGNPRDHMMHTEAIPFFE